MKRIDKTNKATEEKCTDFANTIYKIRTERGITQQGLADLIGVSNRTISKWEQGTTVPDLETIKKLREKYKNDPTYCMRCWTMRCPNGSIIHAGLHVRSTKLYRSRRLSSTFLRR